MLPKMAEVGRFAVGLLAQELGLFLVPEPTALNVDYLIKSPHLPLGKKKKWKLHLFHSLIPSFTFYYFCFPVLSSDMISSENHQE